MRKARDSRPHFRSAARAAGYEYLESRLREARRLLRDNRFKLATLAQDQRQLKNDISALSNLMTEYLK